MLSHFHLYGELRFPGVMGRRNSPSGLREDDDDDVRVRVADTAECLTPYLRRSIYPHCFYNRIQPSAIVFTNAIIKLR